LHLPHESNKILSCASLFYFLSKLGSSSCGFNDDYKIHQIHVHENFLQLMVWDLACICEYCFDEIWKLMCEYSLDGLYLYYFENLVQRNFH